MGLGAGRIKPRLLRFPERHTLQTVLSGVVMALARRSVLSNPASLVSLALLGLASCTGGAPRGSETRDAAGADTTSATSTGAGWEGRLTLRGTLEGGRSVAGTLDVTPLTAGSPERTATESRVRQTYPSYSGPYLGARLALGGNGDSVRGEFTCAHGPSSPPPLVCEPSAPLAGLEHATLVVQPSGRAVLTGSHGEGVTVVSGRFTWERSGTP